MTVGGQTFNIISYVIWIHLKSWKLNLHCRQLKWSSIWIWNERDNQLSANIIDSTIKKKLLQWYVKAAYATSCLSSVYNDLFLILERNYHSHQWGQVPHSGIYEGREVCDLLWLIHTIIGNFAIGISVRGSFVAHSFITGSFIPGGFTTGLKV